MWCRPRKDVHRRQLTSLNLQAPTAGVRASIRFPSVARDARAERPRPTATPAAAPAANAAHDGIASKLASMADAAMNAVTDDRVGRIDITCHLHLHHPSHMIAPCMYMHYARLAWCSWTIKLSIWQPLSVVRRGWDSAVAQPCLDVPTCHVHRHAHHVAAAGGHDPAHAVACSAASTSRVIDIFPEWRENGGLAAAVQPQRCREHWPPCSAGRQRHGRQARAVHHGTS